jgi:putative sigma-54 modulation protein
MKLSTILSLAMLSQVAAFAPSSSVNRMNLVLQSSTEAVNYVITGNNIEVTDALNDYINKKLDNTVGKLSGTGAIKECDVHLNVNKNPKVKQGHTAEVVTFVKGTVIRCSETSEDMYASIDAVTDRLSKKLKKYKERRLEGYHGGPNMGENLAEVLDSITVEDSASDDDEFVDPEAPVVTKIKSYDLKNSISVEEAIFALGYVDHDFYVFREKETNEINVVYKRNAGGYGLIEPQQD